MTIDSRDVIHVTALAQIPKWQVSKMRTMFLPGGAGVGVDLVPSRFSRRQHLSKRLTIHSYPNSPAFFLTASHLPSYKIRTVFRQFVPLVRWRFFFVVPCNF